MRRRYLWAALASALATAGCAPEIPSGVYVCERNGDCPPDQLCDTDGLCRRDVECAPETCESLRANCGTIDDGCGGTLDCGECATGTCGGGGIPNLCGCDARDCTTFECGLADNGCGETIDCGGCGVGETCEGNTCSVCASEDCMGRCGLLLDQCGAQLDCGGCEAGETCGAAAPNQCGVGTCTPITCGDAGAACGFLADGCGALVDCGRCVGTARCGVNVPNQCGCNPTTCAAEDELCGTIDDGCGGTLACDRCPMGTVCMGTRCQCADTVCAADQCGGGLCGCGACGSGGACMDEACVCAADPGEPNDEIGDLIGSLGSLPTDGVFTFDEGVIEHGDDDDWYGWLVDSAALAGSVEVEVRLEGIAPGDDYDLEVIVECAGGAPPGACEEGAPTMSDLGPSCRSEAPGSANELVRLAVPITPDCMVTSFFVHVDPAMVAPRCHPYTLDVKLSRAGLPF